MQSNSNFSFINQSQVICPYRLNLPSTKALDQMRFDHMILSREKSHIREPTVCTRRPFVILNISLILKFRLYYTVIEFMIIITIFCGHIHQKSK